ncbi:MAG: hypothetical protein ACOX29_10380 [Bacillota bacterium]
MQKLAHWRGLDLRRLNNAFCPQGFEDVPVGALVFSREGFCSIQGNFAYGNLCFKAVTSLATSSREALESLAEASSRELALL